MKKTTKKKEDKKQIVEIHLYIHNQPVAPHQITQQYPQNPNPLNPFPNQYYTTN